MLPSLMVNFITKYFSLDHSLYKLVDFHFSVTEITTLNIMVVLFAPSTGWCVQLEGPDEVVDLSEDTSNGIDLIDEIFNALNTITGTQFTLDNKVVGDWNTLAGMLHISALVNQLLDRLQGWIAPGNVWLSNTQHIDGGFV